MLKNATVVNTKVEEGQFCLPQVVSQKVGFLQVTIRFLLSEHLFSGKPLESLSPLVLQIYFMCLY